MSISRRRIMMLNWVSADGYFADAKGGLDWVVPADEQVQAAAAGIAQIDTVLLGRRTYEIFAQFWPNAVNESGDPAPKLGPPEGSHSRRFKVGDRGGCR
jgi:dihydrofolate reductase